MNALSNYLSEKIELGKTDWHLYYNVTPPSPKHTISKFLSYLGNIE